MNSVENVEKYIKSNVLHSNAFDKADSLQKEKAVNQARNMLVRFLPHIYSSLESVPVEDVAEQALWLLKMDDSVQRAEQGAKSIRVDGITINYSDMDRTIAPIIQRLHGVRSIRQMKVARYVVPKSNTFRGLY